MRSLLLSLAFIASCSCGPTENKTPPPTSKSQPTSVSKASLPVETPPKNLPPWKTFIVDYSFSDSGETRGEVRLRSDGYFEVNEAGKTVGMIWLSAAQVDSLATALTETNWETKKPEDKGIPSRSYKLELNAPGKKLSLESDLLAGSKEEHAAANLIEELRKKALTPREVGNKNFSIEISSSSTGGTVPVLRSTRVSSNGAVSQSRNELGVEGTTIDGAQLIPLRDAYAAFAINTLPERLPEKDLNGMFMHTTTVKIIGDINKTLIRSAEGINAQEPIEPELERFIREVMFVANRALLSSPSMQMSLSCEQHGAGVSTEKYFVDSATKSASFSENEGAAKEKKLDQFMLSMLVGVLKSPQMKTFLGEKPKVGPEMPGVEKCTLSFTLNSEASSVSFSSADQYTNFSKEAISSLWSTLNWALKND